MAFHGLLSLRIAILGIAAAVSAARAQGSAGLDLRPGATPPAIPGSPDSATVLKAARRAQAAFERVRRRFLPREQSAPTSRRETVGRFVYWDEDDTSEYALPEPPPAESPRIIEARTALLARLDSAITRLPGDDWLAGQQVRYLIEAGALETAEARATACTATRWWCHALLGLVHHAAWRYPAADSAFAAALGTMPEAERCEWTNLAVLLADSLQASYRRVPCADRDAVNDRIWWLADPLQFRAGNDRRTEHYARATMEGIQHGAASGYGLAWRDDLGELLRRYGWPSYFAQGLPQPGRNEPPGITAYDPTPSYHFLADADPVESLRGLSERRWTLRPAHSRERYAPPYATFATLRQLTSLFRRGDSVLIVTAYDVRDDTLMPTGPLTAALVYSASPTSGATQRVRHDASARGTLTMLAPATPLLASIEVLGGNRVRRARLGVALADSSPRRIRISDVAFFVPSDSLPATVDAFLQVASTSATARRGEKLGLFWELYGIRATDDEVTLRVQVIREGRSWLRRAGERVGLIGRQGSVGFGWREDARDDQSIAPRSIVVDLASLDPGEYRIEVSLTRANDAPVTASRRLEIIR